MARQLLVRHFEMRALSPQPQADPALQGHANLSHFGGNIIGLFGFSYLLEMYQSAYIITPLFFMGTIHGNLSFYYTKPYAFAIGVSQGVFSIVGMNIANILLYEFVKFALNKMF